MKKFFKVLGIIVAVIFGITIIAGVIGSFFEDDSEPIKPVKQTSRFDEIKTKLESVADTVSFNAYFNEIEEIAKSDSLYADSAKAFLKYKPDYKFSMQQRQLANWVEYAKEEFPKQFSEWDGSNKYLVAGVKKVMNDPSSFKHVETKFEYGSGYRYIRVMMKYSGKNAYNARMTETIIAKIDIKGNILEVE